MAPQRTELDRLEARVAADLRLLAKPEPSWTLPHHGDDGQPVLDVVVIGAGVSGLAAASRLRLAGIERMVVLDRAPLGFEGPWATTARMETLRTSKDSIGPSPDLPSLTPRAWFEAVHGELAWQSIDYFPRESWMAYLRWFRRTLDLPVRNETVVARLEPLASGRLRITAEGTAGMEVLLARRVVVATGFGGMGGPALPGFARELPSHLVAHSSDDIDYRALRGKRVGIVGVGASAVDNAATALEHGAAGVDIFCRRASVPAIQRARAVMNIGCFEGFGMLTADEKAALISLVDGNPPPRHSLLRLNRSGPYQLHLGVQPKVTRTGGADFVIQTERGEHRLDFLVCATGFEVDLTRRPEWSDLEPLVAMTGESGRTPLVDPSYRLVESAPGTCAAVRHVYCLADPAISSQGIASVSVTGIRSSIPRMVTDLVGSLFAEDADRFLALARGYDVAEFAAHEWTPFPSHAPSHVSTSLSTATKE